MRLTDILQTRKSVIIRSCFERVAGTYPELTASFLKKEQDMFLNPVGDAITATFEALFTELTGGDRTGDLKGDLERFVKIKAVQCVSPSEGLSFIRFLKEEIQKEIEAEAAKNGALEELLRDYLRFEDKLDDALFAACDLFVEYRARIDNIRINEIKAAKKGIERVLDAMTRPPMHGRADVEAV
jgi:hypothetical protein